jgi:BASS family bile acid:Na+ symporter
MNVLRKIEMFSSLYISYFILLGALLGVLFPNTGKILSSQIFPSLFILMLFASIKIDVNKLGLALKKKRLITLTISIMYVIPPFILFMIAKILNIKSEYLIGVVFSALAPTIISAPYFIQKIKGDVELSYVLAILSTVLFPILSPLFLYIYFTKNISVEYCTIIYSMVILIVLPLFVAILLKRYERVIEKLKDHESTITSFSFLIFMWAIISLNNEFINSLSIEFFYLFIIAFVQEIFAYFVIKIICIKVFSIKVMLAKTIAFILAVKNTALTAGIAQGISSDLALPSAMVVLMHVPMFFIIGYYKDKL